MKKLLFILSITALVAACNNEAKTDDKATGDSTASISPTTTDSTANVPVTAAPVKDSVMQFKDGKVLISVAGAWSPLTAQVTTTNGRKVNPNGEVSKGAVTRKMEEGMMIDKDGQMMDKDGKMMDNTGWE